MAGTINLAFTQQFDMDGLPLSGGLLSFFTAGTTTPQSAFQDTGLTIVHPNPIVLDASGRVPMFYLADGFIKIRLTDKNGVTVIAADQLLVIGPSSGGGGGGGGTGDVTQVLTTGDIKARYDTGAKDGFVRLNGQSIGNVGSSATERQEAVCQPLFVYLWAFPNITLDGFAKGANALADFNAGRRMFLPDLRGRTIAGLDDMGAATAALRLTSAGLGVSALTLGNAGGAETKPIAQTNIPNYSLAATGLTWTFTTGSTDNGGNGSTGGRLAVHQHDYTNASALITLNQGTGSTVPNVWQGTTVSKTGTDDSDHTHAGPFHNHTIAAVAGTVGGSLSSGGLGTPLGVVQPAMVMTFYMKM